MAIYVVENVPLLPQDKTNGCWYFSAKMMAGWATKAGKSIKDPSELTDLKNLYEGNCGWALSTGGVLAGKLGMTTYPRKERDFKEMLTILKKGPLWAAGVKPNGNDAFPHVVVIGGVADTGVLVLDPLPINKGERSWKTWDWFNKFLAKDNTVLDVNLLGPN